MPFMVSARFFAPMIWYVDQYNLFIDIGNKLTSRSNVFLKSARYSSPACSGAAIARTLGLADAMMGRN